MFFSPKLLESLLLELASGPELDAEALHNLLYHLTLPGLEVPFAIAEVIVRHPDVAEQPSQLPPRLAYGIVEDGMVVFDTDVREEKQRKFFRKIAFVRLGLKKKQFPETVIDTLQRRYVLLRFSEAEGVFTLFALAFVLMGVLMAGLGIVGEYIGRIYQEVRGRPRYSVRRIYGPVKREAVEKI